MQAYRYSYVVLLVPVKSTLCVSSSTPGSQYDPVYENIEPSFGSKLFGLGGGEHGRVTEAMIESDSDHQLQNVGPKDKGGRIKNGLLHQLNCKRVLCLEESNAKRVLI